MLRLFAVMWLVACAQPESPEPTPTPTPTPPAETADTSEDTAPPDPCADLPTVTYNNFGRGFITEACQGCHASTAPHRFGAPEDVIFDTVADCWERKDRILTRSTGPSPSMPPQGGVSEDDRTRLLWWLQCAPSGT